MANQGEKVLVGFSGGLDSTAAIYFLKKAGYSPVAFYLDFFGKKSERKKVKEVASDLGVEIIIEDKAEFFKEKIIDYFIDEYFSGKTPNPCVKCNAEVKFYSLLEKADALGIDKIATGHYAKIIKEGECFFVGKAKDETKDQSYFLYRLNQDILSRAIFPLQDKTKQENRDFLMKKGVNFIEEESQDVCFFGKREKLEDFIKKSSNKTKSGEIMDEEGNFLGWHKGVIYYTEGQRKGLYLGGGGPYYIIKKDITENKIIVSNNPDHPLLKSSKILLSDCNWICKEPEEGKTYLFKSRYQSNYSKGVFVKSKEKGWTVFLEDSQYAAAPGQSLVVYEEDKVIGGGIIKSD